MEAKLKRNILIIGGTGTLGQELLKKIDPCKTIIFSRDELKQHELRHKYPNLKCVIGDIRDQKSLEYAFDDNIEWVFHVAALKHVDILEHNPEEAYKTNILGTINSAELAKKYNVTNFYFTSTDKAVMPVNVYGMTKAISERYLLNQNKSEPSGTVFRVFRWGNILGSRGSVVSLFVNSLKEENKIYVTDKKMTRFWIRIEDAVRYMLGFKGDSTKVNFPEMKTASICNLGKAIADVMGIKRFEIKEIGIRPGEKIHECLYSSHDKCIRSDDISLAYSHSELVDLIRPIVEKML